MKYEVLNVNDLEISFIHLKDGRNVFDDEGISLLLGVERPRATKLRNQLNKLYGADVPGRNIRLKSPVSGRLRTYSFFEDILQMVVLTRTKKAMKLVSMTGQLLNEKFNSVVFCHGFIGGVK